MQIHESTLHQQLLFFIHQYRNSRICLLTFFIKIFGHIYVARFFAPLCSKRSTVFVFYYLQSFGKVHNTLCVGSVVKRLVRYCNGIRIIFFCHVILVGQATNKSESHAIPFELFFCSHLFFFYLQLRKKNNYQQHSTAANYKHCFGRNVFPN